MNKGNILNTKKSSDKRDNREKNNKNEKKNKKERSRENTPTKKEDEIITIKIIDDSNSQEPISISKYIQQNKDDYDKQKITIEEYITKNDVDQEKIVLVLEDLLNKDKNEFYNLYSKEQFKLTLDNRFKFQEKFKNNKDLPVSISKNIIDCKSIKKIFINILSNIDKMNLNVDIYKINEVFNENKVFFDKEIDCKVPNKYGSIELRYYSLLSDLFYYFNSKPEISLKSKLKVFSDLSSFIKKMNDLENEELICCSNLLINILYMFLDNQKINHPLFYKIVDSCLPFDINIANKVLQLLILNNKTVVKLNGILINDKNCVIKTGDEIITLEDESEKKKNRNKS